MVWGQAAAKGIDELALRLKNNDAGLQSLTILRFRRFDDDVSMQFPSAIATKADNA